MLPINPVWRTAAAVGLLLAAVAAVYALGYRHAAHTAAAQRTELQAQWQAQALAAEREYSAALAQAAAEKQRWYDYAQHQSVQLADAVRQLDARPRQLKQEIPHALKRDQNHDACRPGLGSDGLRLYRHALGYPD